VSAARLRQRALPVAVVALLAVEAWLAAGSGRSESRLGVGGWAGGVAGVLGGLVMGASIAIVAIALGPVRARRSGIVGTRPRPLSAPWIVRALAILLPIFVLAFAVTVAILLSHAKPAPPRPGEGPIESARPSAQRLEHHGTSRSDRAWGWIAGAAVLVGLGGTVLLLRPGAHRIAERRERRRAEASTAALDEAAAELRDVPDPRRAILIAYARMERTLSVIGLGRKASEAPREYLRRLDDSEAAAGAAASRLTRLYELARFATEPVSEPMRQEALRAVADVRRTIPGAEA